MSRASSSKKNEMDPKHFVHSEEIKQNMDYSNFYENMRGFVANPSEEYTPVLYLNLFCHLNASAAGIFTMEQKAKFMNTYLPKLMKEIVNFSYNKQHIKVVLIYLKLITAFFSFNIHTLTQFIDGVALILQIIFKQTRNFYLACGDLIKDNTWSTIFNEIKQDTGLQIVAKSLKWSDADSAAMTETAYTFLVLCFERSNGFSQVNSVISMAEVNDKHALFVGRLLKTISYISELRIKDYSSAIEASVRNGFEYGKKLVQHLQDHPLASSDQLKASSIGKLLRGLRRLSASASSSQQESMEKLETHYQKTLLVAFKSGNSELRKSALTEIIRIISHLSSKWPTGKKKDDEEALKVVEILRSEKIFDVIYRSSSLSVDAIRLVTEKELVCFMYAWKLIQKNEIEAIWMTILQKSGERYLQGLVIASLIKILPHFCRRHAHQLFSYLKQTELYCFANDHYIEMIEALAINEFNRMFKRKSCGIFIANEPDFEGEDYKNSNDENIGNITELSFLKNLPILDYVISYLFTEAALAKRLPIAAQNKLAKKFTSLITSYYVKPPANYGNKFVEKVREYISKDINPNLMATIYYPLRVAVPDDPTLDIYLLKCVSDNFLKLKEVVKLKATKLSPEEIDSFCINPYSKRTYKSEVTSRLNTMKDLIPCIQLSNFDPEQIEPIFESLFKHSISVSEKASGYLFLINIIQKYQYENMLWNGSFEKICMKYLMNVDPSESIYEYCMALENYLMHYNLFIKKSASHDKKYHTIKIKKWDLYGFNKIWEVMCFSYNEKARQWASKFLLEIYLCLEPALTRNSGKAIIKECLMNCASYLRNGIELNLIDSSKKQAEKCIERIFKWLDRLKSEIEDPYKPKADKPYAKNAPEFQFSFLVHDSNTEKHIHIIVKANITLKELIETILTQMSVKKSDFSKKTCKTKEKVIINSDTITIYEAGMSDTDCIMVSDYDYQLAVESYPKIKRVVPIDLNEWRGSIEYLRQFYPDYEDEIFIAALRRAEGNKEQAGGLLSDKHAFSHINHEAYHTKVFSLKRAYYENKIFISRLLQEMDEINFKTFLESMKFIKADEYWTSFSIHSLPQNASITSMMKADFPDSEIKWKINLNLDSPFECLYILDIIFADIEARETWIEEFSMSGGYKFIAKLIGETSLDSLILSKIENREHNIKFYIDEMNYLLLLLNSQLKIEVNEAYNNFIDCFRSYFGNEIAERRELKSDFTIGKATIGQIVQVLAGSLRMIYKNIIAIITKHDIFSNDDENIMKKIMLTLAELFFIIGALITLDKHDANLFDDPSFWGGFPILLLRNRKKKSLNAVFQETLYKFILFVNELTAKKAQGKAKRCVPSVINFFSSFPNPKEEYANCDLYFKCFRNSLAAHKETSTAGASVLPLSDFVEKIVNVIRLRRSSMQKHTKDELLRGYFLILNEYISKHFTNSLNVDHPLSNSINPKIVEALLKILISEIRLAGALPSHNKEEMENTCLAPLSNNVLAVAIMPLIQNLFLSRKLLSESQKLIILETLFEFITEISRRLPEVIKAPEPIALSPPTSPKKIQIAPSIEPYADFYCGLVNFAATCYVNALLQQLFMMPILRKNILKLSSDKLPYINCDHVLKNLQTIFKSLANPYSLETKCFSPISFCNDFKGFDGKPIEYFVQHDVDEFFILLLEQMENEFQKIPEYCGLIKSLFGIHLINKLESAEDDVEYRSENIEDHYKIMLDIKHKKTLEEALDSMIEGELMENENGVEIAELGRRIKARKYCKIKSLNDLCVIHLKRIEFNMRTQTRKKINDYCSFPKVINFTKWMEKDSPKADINGHQNEFALVGIILHAGVAESGHYTSIIKERNKKHPNYGKWYHFNDRVVSEISEKELETYFFGNEQTLFDARHNDDNGEAEEETDSQEEAAPNMEPCAYLLFYERVKKKKQKNSSENEEDKDENEEESKMVKKAEQEGVAEKLLCDIKFTECVANMGIAYLREQDSGLLESDKWMPKSGFVFNKDISKKGLSDFRSFDTVGSLLGKILLHYIVEISGRISESDNILKICQIKMTDGSDASLPQVMLLNNNHYLCFFFLSYLLDPSKKHLLFSILFRHQLPEVREFYSNTILIALQTLLMCEEPYILEFNSDSQTYSSFAIRFILLLFQEGLPIARENHLTANFYFMTLKNAIGNFRYDAAPLISGKPGKAIAKIIDFIANTKFSLLDNSAKPQIDPLSPAFLPALQLLDTLLRCGSTKSMIAFKSAPDYSLYPLEELVSIPEEELMLWFKEDKWNYLDLLPKSQKELVIILIIMTWGDATRTKLMMNRIVNEIVLKRVNPEAYGRVLWLAKELINNSKDNSTELRFASFFANEIGSQKDNLFSYMRKIIGSDTEKWAIDVITIIAELYQNGDENLREIIKKYFLPEVNLWIYDEFKRFKSKYFIGEYGMKVKKIIENIITPLMNDNNG